MWNSECTWKSPRCRCIYKNSSTRQMYHLTGLAQLKERESKAEEIQPARIVLCWGPPREGGWSMTLAQAQLWAATSFTWDFLTQSITVLCTDIWEREQVHASVFFSLEEDIVSMPPFLLKSMGVLLLTSIAAELALVLIAAAIPLLWQN